MTEAIPLTPATIAELRAIPGAASIVDELIEEGRFEVKENGG